MRRHGFTLAEILCVIVLLGILAAIIVPQFLGPPITPKQQDEAVRKARVEVLGFDWNNVSSGDLVKFGNGNIYLIIGSAGGTGFNFRSGLPNTPDSIWYPDEIASRSPTLIRKSDPQYNEMCRQFARQMAGLPKENSDPPDSDNNENNAALAPDN